MLSRPGSPIVAKPSPKRTLSRELDLNGKLSPPTAPNGTVISHAAPSKVVLNLEAKVNGS